MTLFKNCKESMDVKVEELYRGLGPPSVVG